MTLKERIQYLLDHGMTCGQIARIAECSDSTILKWMKSSSDYTISKRLQEIIELHVSAFIEELHDVWNRKSDN